MNSLGEQFLKLGLTDEKSAREAQAEQTLAAEEAARPKKPRAKGAFGKLTGEESRELLRDADTIRRFRIAARAFLLWFPERTQEVIDKAHRFKKEEGGKKLLWQVYTVRDNLPEVPLDERDRYLFRALRSKNPKPVYEPPK